MGTWITEGACADQFVTAVRTVIPRGRSRRAAARAPGPALVVFRDVAVPAGNPRGAVNFNHERWMIVQQVLGKRLADQPVTREKLARAGTVPRL